MSKDIFYYQLYTDGPIDHKHWCNSKVRLDYVCNCGYVECLDEIHRLVEKSKKQPSEQTK